MRGKQYSVGRFIGILIVGLILLSLPTIIMRIASYKSDSARGLAYTREAYVASCTRVATSNDSVDIGTAKAYCGCVYDRGTNQYGLEKFSQMDSEASNTNTISPEANDLINKCLVEIGVN